MSVIPVRTPWTGYEVSPDIFSTGPDAGISVCAVAMPVKTDLGDEPSHVTSATTSPASRVATDVDISASDARATPE